MRTENGGYRRDHLRAPAQRVEVDAKEVRIMGSKSELLRTLVAASSAKRRVLACPVLYRSGAPREESKNTIKRLKIRGFLAAISPYFDAQVGARYDLDSLPGRGWGAFGIEGLAPLFFKVAATGYVSSDGHLAAGLEASYDLLLTQRLILQPQIEMNFYTKDDPARRIGSGLSDIDAGLRLRYEISRKFAPYAGVVYQGKFGGTADFARAEGEAANEVRFVLGVRTWW